jgi:hypothetical protein
MVVPVELLSNLDEVGKKIDAGKKNEANKILEGIVLTIEQILPVLDESEKINLLGVLAFRFGQLGNTNKEIEILEKLCNSAEKDLENKSLFATDLDIRNTGMDFIALSLAYKNNNQIKESKYTLNKGKEILKRIMGEKEITNIISYRDAQISKNKPWWKFW